MNKEVKCLRGRRVERIEWAAPFAAALVFANDEYLLIGPEDWHDKNKGRDIVAAALWTPGILDALTERFGTRC